MKRLFSSIIKKVKYVIISIWKRFRYFVLLRGLCIKDGNLWLKCPDFPINSRWFNKNTRIFDYVLYRQLTGIKNTKQ